MNETANNTVACPACRKRYVWKADLAGRAVRCACGKAFVIPAAPQPLPAGRGGEPVELGADDFEALQAEPAPPLPVKCPSCNLTMKPGAAVCLNCGYDTRRGSKVRTQVLEDVAEEAEAIEGDAASTVAAGSATPSPTPFLPPADDFIAPTETIPAMTRADGRGRGAVAAALARREDDATDSRFIDIYLPIIFLVAGIGLTLVHSAQIGDSMGEGLLKVAIHLLIKIPLMLGALIFSARLMGITYGPLSIGLLKLAGIAMGPMALADVILAAIISATMGFGIWLGAFIYIIIAGIPLSFMFDLEMMETLITLVVIVVLQVFFSFFLMVVIMGMFA